MSSDESLRLPDLALGVVWCGVGWGGVCACVRSTVKKRKKEKFLMGKEKTQSTPQKELLVRVSLSSQPKKGSPFLCYRRTES
jgi:hypothetical protein